MGKASRHFDLRLLQILLFVTALSVGAAGQIAGGLTETTRTDFGGNGYITGTVYYPSGTPVNYRMRLLLSSLTGGEVIATTDDSGKFVFSKLAIGTYTLAVEGEKDFEAVSQQVEIMRRGDVQNVNIRLTDRGRKADKAKAVNVENVKVPQNALDSYEAAVALSAKGDPKGAIVKLNLAIEQFPEFMLAHTELAAQYLRLNEFSKADESLKVALKLRPDAYEPLITQATLLFRTNRLDESEQYCRQALKARENSAVAYFYLGRIFQSTNRFEAAETQFRNAIKYGGPQMREAHRMLANMYIRLEDFKKALVELEAYLKLYPDAPDAEQLNGVARELRRLTAQK
jgi:tetratricopeptide (TPR) repeat protein